MKKQQLHETQKEFLKDVWFGLEFDVQVKTYRDIYPSNMLEGSIQERKTLSELCDKFSYGTNILTKKQANNLFQRLRSVVDYQKLEAQLMEVFQAFFKEVHPEFVEELERKYGGNEEEEETSLDPLGEYPEFATVD